MPREGALLLAAGQHRDEIVARPDDAFVDERRDVLEHSLHAVGQDRHAVVLAAADVQQLLGELSDIGPILGGHTHHLRDHQHRQRGRQIPHHIHAALFLGRVEELLHGVDDKRPP